MPNHQRVFWVALILALSGSSSLVGAPADISGTWAASVNMGTTIGEPIFMFKQDGEKLTGSITNPGGKREITGTVKGDKAVFGFEATREGGTVKGTYSGTIESPTRMKGTVNFSGVISGSGTWVATKK
jgi:hypothetical protein